MLLTDEERRRFAEYLERDAASGNAIAGELEKVGLPHLLTLAKMHRAEATAELVVAKKLRAMESMTLEK